MIAEFGDSALMKAFGQEGAGIFVAPTAIEEEVEWQYQATAIGRVNEVKERFYAISVERRVTRTLLSLHYWRYPVRRCLQTNSRLHPECSDVVTPMIGKSAISNVDRSKSR